ncbi:hypothetical protein Tsubulata_022502 [Turnera subulata]|uniref:Protein kinase domain-containing protein n=1 Tax=Turnera subulata TaxID=218843 RepID=A0A9Q0JDC1_9ROSI|nr:hypothetical protein Tsubulata_022502 [Turnera subulata]
MREMRLEESWLKSIDSSKRKKVEDPDLCCGRYFKFTDGFTQEKLIGNFQFGKVYLGVRHNGKKVTVKVWEEENNLYTVLPGDNEIRFLDEVEFLEFFRRREEKKKSPYHRNLVRLYESYQSFTHGVSLVVYDLDPIDTVQNLLDKDAFTWQMRIKVALGIASLLKFLHAERPQVPFIIRNLAASHIMLDQAQEPILYDFSMISGGNLYDKRNILNEHVNGCHGCVDPTSARPGAWSEKCDVFSYGVLLLQLVSKVVDPKEVGTCDKQTIFDWAWGEYESQKFGSNINNFSLVHPNLESNPLFDCIDGVKVTKLALRCVHNDPQKRPSMEQVHSHLLKLNLARFDEKVRNLVVLLLLIYVRISCQHPQLICHPSMVKLIGYCHENEHFGVVYDLKGSDTLFNLILKDRLTWAQIIKIGIGIASLLEFLHTDIPPSPPYVVRNISASHIMLDQLIDYGQLAGGILPGSRIAKHDRAGGDMEDVYEYGQLLLSMLCKKVRDINEPDIAYWAVEEFKTNLLSSDGDCSLVHQSFIRDEGYNYRDAIKVTKLAMQCVEYHRDDRPTMEQVVKRLLKLHIVGTHSDQFCINYCSSDDVARS